MEGDYSDGITKAPIVIDNVNFIFKVSQFLLGFWCN